MQDSRQTRRALTIWAIAVLVYLAAVFHRTSLGVASIEASARFGLGPAALGTFTVLQVGVYALMQIPTGLLVDRYGPRRVLTVAALLMGLGQLLFAFATSYPLGLLARAVLGVGDAMTFVSVLRLVAAHFPARRYAALAVDHRRARRAGQPDRDAAARRAARERRLDRDVRRGRRRHRPVRRRPRAARAGQRGRHGRRHRDAAGARVAGRGPAPGPARLAHARYPARLLGALLHDVRPRDARPAVGLPVPGAGAGPRPVGRERDARRCWWSARSSAGP